MGLPDLSASPVFDRLYSEIDELPSDVPRYPFAGLDRAACEEIFERCLGRKPPRAWTGIWTDRIVEADYDEIYRDMMANAKGFANFYSGIF